MLTREDYEKGKPHPDGYLLGIERSGFSAEECVAVEDSPRGAEAARRAGTDCVLLGKGGEGGNSAAGIDAGAPRLHRVAGFTELGELLRGFSA